jgi:hypothetical protein
MARLLTVVLAVVVVVVLAIVGAGLYLAYGNFAPAAAPVEKVLPDARFPK